MVTAAGAGGVDEQDEGEHPGNAGAVQEQQPQRGGHLGAWIGGHVRCLRG
jgi:hypothetical protein